MIVAMVTSHSNLTLQGFYTKIHAIHSKTVFITLRRSVNVVASRMRVLMMRTRDENFSESCPNVLSSTTYQSSSSQSYIVVNLDYLSELVIII